MSGIAGGHGLAGNVPLDLLANPEQLEKRLKQLKDAQEAAEKTVALAGKAEDILRLRQDLKDEVAEQEALTAKAREEAAEIVAQAKQEANAIQEEATKMAEEISEDAEQAVAEAVKAGEAAKKAMSELDEKRGSMENMKRSLTDLANRLDDREKELDAKETSLLNEKSALVAVYEQMKNILE